MREHPRNVSASLLAWAVAAMVLTPVGCGQSGPSRYEVSGTVTYQGKPVPNGEITFQPDTTQGNQGPGSVAPIRSGQYETPPGRGITGGAYIVRIVHIPEEDEAAGTAEPLWFHPFETRATLPADDTVQDFQVAR